MGGEVGQGGAVGWEGQYCGSDRTTWREYSRERQ